MNFPADAPVVVDDPVLVAKVEGALGQSVLSLHKGTTDFLAILAGEDLVRGLKPVLSSVAELDARGIIVSCKSQFMTFMRMLDMWINGWLIAAAKDGDLDFVSRCFYPAYGINEDPFTGSAHCVLGCYWSVKLGKTKLQGKEIH